MGRSKIAGAATAATLIAAEALTSGCTPVNSSGDVEPTSEPTTSHTQPYYPESPIELPKVTVDPFTDIGDVSTQSMFNENGDFNYTQFSKNDQGESTGFDKYTQYIEASAQKYAELCDLDENIAKALISSVIHQKIDHRYELKEGDEYIDVPIGPMQIIPKYSIDSYNQRFGTNYSPEDIYKDEKLAIDLGAYHLFYPLENKSTIILDSKGQVSLGKLLCFFYGGTSVANAYNPELPIEQQNLVGWAKQWLGGIEGSMNSLGVHFRHSPTAELFEETEFVVDESPFVPTVTAPERESEEAATPTPGAPTSTPPEPTPTRTSTKPTTEVPPTRTPYQPQEPTATPTPEATATQIASVMEKGIESGSEVERLELSNFYEGQAGVISIDYDIYGENVNESGDYNYAYFVNKFPYFEKLIPHIEKYSEVYSAMYGIDRNFLRVFFSSVYATESSGGNPQQYLSSTGCIGAGQVSWESHGPEFNATFGTNYTKEDLYNDEVNVRISMWAYLRYYNNLGKIFHEDGAYPSIELLSHYYKHGFRAYGTYSDDMDWFILTKKHLEANGVFINYGNFLDPYDLSSSTDGSKAAVNLEKYGFTPLTGLPEAVVENLTGKIPGLSVISVEMGDGRTQKFLTRPLEPLNLPQA